MTKRWRSKKSMVQRRLNKVPKGARHRTQAKIRRVKGSRSQRGRAGGIKADAKFGRSVGIRADAKFGRSVGIMAERLTLKVACQ